MCRSSATASTSKICSPASPNKERRKLSPQDQRAHIVIVTQAKQKENPYNEENYGEQQFRKSNIQHMVSRRWCRHPLCGTRCAHVDDHYSCAGGSGLPVLGIKISTARLYISAQPRRTAADNIHQAPSDRYVDN